MNYFLQRLLVFVLLLFCIQAKAGNAYFNNKLANFYNEADLNGEQQRLLKTEAEAYEKAIAPLYTTNLDEYKKKLNDFFTKLAFGFKVYNLTGRNKTLTDSLDSFYSKTNLKVYVISYVEGAFLNNLFQKLAELKYKVKANKSIEVKIKFKKKDESNEVDLFNYTASLIISDVVRDTLKNILRTKFQKQIDIDNNYNNLTASVSGQNYAIYKTTSEIELNQKMGEILNRFELLGIHLSQSTLNTGPWATFIDPSGNAFSTKIGSDFRIVSAIKDGPILSFKADNQLYEAKLIDGKFYWYQSKGGTFGLEKDHEILPSTWGLWVIRRSGTSAPYTCYIPADYDYESKTFKSITFVEDNLQYSQIPNQYATSSSPLAEGLPQFGSRKPSCVTMSSVNIQFEGSNVTEEKIQFAGQQDVIKITFAADKLAASAAELDKKYESVKKSSPGTKLSFHENGFIVTIDDKGGRTSKPISKEDFDKLVQKIESGDISTESEVIYSKNENNNPVVAGLGYNKTFKPGKPGFSFNTSQRTDLQNLQKEKLNNYFSKNNVTDLLGKSQARSTDQFPDGTRTEIQSVSYYEVTLQVVKITGKIIRDFRIPESFYNSSSGDYKDCMIHTSPYFSGVGNGLIEEFLSIPQLVVLGTEVLLDTDMQDSLVAKFKRLTPEKIKNGFINAGKSITTTITGTSDKNWHDKGTMTVQVATLAMAATKILKKGADDAIPKDADEALEEVGDVTKALDDISSKAFKLLNKLKNKLDDLTDAQKELFKKDLDDAGFYKYVDEATDPDAIVDAWKVLDDAGRSALRKEASTLDALKGLLTNNKLKQVFDKEYLKELAEAQKAAGTATVPAMKELFDNINAAFKDLDLSKIQGMDLLKGELKRTDFGKMIGSNWILEYMGKNQSLFKSFNKIIFESVEKIDDVTGSLVRKVDVKSLENGVFKFFEFKSVSRVPPVGFADQFIKDLRLADVSELGQLKWMFDGKKISSLTKADFVDAIKNVESLDNAKIRSLFNKFASENDLGSVLNQKQLIKFLESNDDWFNLIFKVE